MNPWQMSLEELEICQKNPKFDLELFKLLHKAYQTKVVCIGCNQDLQIPYSIPVLCKFHFAQWLEDRKGFEKEYYRFDRDLNV